MERICKRNVLAGLAAVLVAGATIFGMEKTGLPSAESELQRAQASAYWGHIPVAKKYIPGFKSFLGRLAWDGIPALIAITATYYFLAKKN
jgi:hypothetical protein